MLCPPNGENKAVMYYRKLRGVRTTFENYNAVRSAFEGLGFFICERDISMDKGFRDELRKLMKGKESSELIPPPIFVKGRYIGGFEKVMKMLEEGSSGELLKGMPKVRVGHVCEGCAGVRFLPCFTCNGGCKTVMMASERMEMDGDQAEGAVVLGCRDVMRTDWFFTAFVLDQLRKVDNFASTTSLFARRETSKHLMHESSLLG